MTVMIVLQVGRAAAERQGVLIMDPSTLVSKHMLTGIVVVWAGRAAAEGGGAPGRGPQPGGLDDPGQTREGYLLHTQ